MFVPENSDISYKVDQETYYFCSTACRQQYSSPELEYSKLRKWLTVGWSLPIPVLLISYVIPQSYFGGISYKDYTLLFLAFPVQFYSGYGFYQGAYHAVKSLTGNKTISKIKQNMAWAVGYNIMLIPVAAGVLVPLIGLSIFFVLPVISAFAMGMS